MSTTAAPAGVQEALQEFQLYLSDQLAPMMVTDSIELLLGCPPQLLASEIHGWVGAQYRGAAATAPVSDCLFHAIKKLHLMSEFHLVEAQQLESYLNQLAGIVLGFCPEAERATLRENLGRLGESSTGSTAAPVEILHRQVGSQRPARESAAPGSPEGTHASADVTQGLRRFSILLERLSANAGSVVAPAQGSAEPGGELRSQILAGAAVQARNAQELDAYMLRLRQMGVETGTDQIFRALGRELPGWTLPAIPGNDQDQPLLPHRSVHAMHRMITTPSEPKEQAKRLGEMVQAAIEQFNEGALAQAATMLGLARRVVREKKIPEEVVDSMLMRSHESISEEHLRSSAEDSQKHELLRRVLTFFPGLRPRAMLDELDGERRREHRKLLLALLEVHGADARPLVMERLEECLTSTRDPEGFFLRNVVYLLRRIPREEDASPDGELERMAQLSRWRFPWLVVREAIGALGQFSHPKAEKALLSQLQEIELHLLKPGDAPFDAAQLLTLLDRTVTGLARMGTPAARTAVVNHCLKRHPQFGDSMQRLEVISGADLSGDAALLGRLIKTLKSELPTKVLGFVMQKDNPSIVRLVHALSGTSAPVVRQVLEDIVERYAERDFAEAAQKALSALGASTPHSASVAQTVINGDLELFGLPNLLQSLSDSQATGELVLVNRDGNPVGTLLFSQGGILDCHVGKLKREVAIYRLFERPVPGTFVLKKRSAADLAVQSSDLSPMEVLPLLLESMRRHDEYQEARGVVPDDARLKADGTAPTPCEGEDDLVFMRSIWVKAAKGVTPEQCEAEIPVDPYRVRRLYAHWVTVGSLVPA